MTNNPHARRKFFIFSGIALSLVMGACRTRNEAKESKIESKLKVEPMDRLTFLSKAKVWNAEARDSVSTRDMSKGPTHKLFHQSHQDVQCVFVEPDPKKPPGGRTPKFECEFDVAGKKKTFKVKFDPYANVIHQKPGKPNYEVYGEVLSTRLLWALGFGADEIYPVRVTCVNCPPDPWLYARQKTGILDGNDRRMGWVRTELLEDGTWDDLANRVFDPAVIEVKYKADEILSEEARGWAWKELFENMEKPEEQHVHREALTILMAFMNHMDNQPTQQRLVCLDKNPVENHCTQPFAMVQDAGSSFGAGWAPFQGELLHVNKLEVEKWERLSTWKNLKRCEVQVQAVPNASWHSSWKVSEEARSFLADLMKQLSHQQIVDLFTAAQVDRTNQKVSVERWVQAFETKLKRDILESRCP